MSQRFEINFRTPRNNATGRTALPRPTNRIKIILQAIAALFVGAVIVTVGIAIGSAVAVLIGVIVTIAFAVLFVRGTLYRLRSPNGR